jgi:hypothetical protein
VNLLHTTLIRNSKIRGTKNISEYSVYSPLYIDQTDFSVKNAFDQFLDSGLYLEDLVSKGPMKFLNT